MRNALVLVLCLALAGCATSVESVVKISTPAPPGTLVIREGNRRYLVSGTGEVKLDPTRDHYLVLEAPGYKPNSLSLTSHVSGSAVAYSIICGLPILPVAIPIWIWLGSSGAWDVLSPENPWVALAREDEAR